MHGKPYGLLLMLLAAALALTLFTACGGSPKPAETPAPIGPGTYAGEYGKWVGSPDEDRDTEPFTLVLTEDGKGKFQRDDSEFRVTWTLEGETFTMQETFLGAVNDYTGTLKDGELVMFTGSEPEDPLAYMYVLHLEK